MSFIEDLAKRRSIYHLGKNVQLSKQEIQNIIEACLNQTPSAFNMPTTHLILAFGDKHEQIWSLTKACLQQRMKRKQETFELASQNIDKISSGIGTILFYEDFSMIKELRETYAMYADSFEQWSQQASGMLQANIWTALANANIGASLQHYNPIIDQKLKELFKIPDDWKLVAQMPFGSIEEKVQAKYIEPAAQRLTVYEN